MKVFSKSASSIFSYARLSPGTCQLTPMYDPCSLRRLCPISDSPLPHLVCSRREEAAQIKHLPHGRNNLWQRGFSTELFAFLLCLRLSLETCEALFKSDGERQYRITRCVLFDPFCNLRKMLVLLSDVVFLAKVNKVDDGFGGEEEERIYGFDLANNQISGASQSVGQSGNIVLSSWCQSWISFQYGLCVV